MATNLDIDDALILRAMALTGIRTKKAAVEAGLKALVMLHEQKELRDLRGRLHWEDERAPAKSRKRARP